MRSRHLIVHSPAREIRLPELADEETMFLTREEILAVADTLGDYRGMACSVGSLGSGSAR
jgi:hypothetical protein